MVKINLFLILILVNVLFPQTKLKSVNTIGGVQNAFGLDLGLNGAEVLGTSPYLALTYVWNLNQLPYFGQVSLFGAPIQSGFSQSVLNSKVFEYDYWVSLDATAAWRFKPWPGATLPATLGPFLLFGLSAMWQGGEPNFGAMFGYGVRTPAPWLNKEKWYLQMQAKDLLAAQRITSLSLSLSQNLQLALGLYHHL